MPYFVGDPTGDPNLENYPYVDPALGQLSRACGKAQGSVFLLKSSLARVRDAASNGQENHGKDTNYEADKHDATRHIGDCSN